MLALCGVKKSSNAVTTGTFRIILDDAQFYKLRTFIFLSISLYQYLGSVGNSRFLSNQIKVMALKSIIIHRLGK